MAKVPWPLLLILLQLALVACQVAIKISSDAPPTFTDELKEPKFIVGVLPEGSSVPPQVRTLPMTDSNGTKYSCHLPALEGQDTTSTSLGVDAALFPQQTPGELLDALTDWCAYRVEDWWTYEVCYKKHVRQYHKEHNKVVSEYLLGRYNRDDDSLNEIHTDMSDISGDVKYVSQQYKNGHPCELNEQPRSVEVRYVCSSAGASAGTSENTIMSIKEPASCSYIIIIATPRLCKHPQFRTHTPPVAVIRCIPQPSAGEHQPAADGGSDGSATARSGMTLPQGDEQHCSTGEAGSSRAVGAMRTPPDASGSGGSRPDSAGPSPQGGVGHAEDGSGAELAHNTSAPYGEDGGEEAGYGGEGEWIDYLWEAGDGEEVVEMDPHERARLWEAMYIPPHSELGEEEDEYADYDDEEEQQEQEQVPTPGGHEEL